MGDGVLRTGYPIFRSMGASEPRHSLHPLTVGNEGPQEREEKRDDRKLVVTIGGHCWAVSERSIRIYWIFSRRSFWVVPTKNQINLVR